MAVEMEMAVEMAVEVEVARAVAGEKVTVAAVQMVAVVMAVKVGVEIEVEVMEEMVVETVVVETARVTMEGTAVVMAVAGGSDCGGDGGKVTLEMVETTVDEVNGGHDEGDDACEVRALAEVMVKVMRRLCGIYGWWKRCHGGGAGCNGVGNGRDERIGD